ncbi:MAG TPA: anti-sigma factor [Candidatus Angelobacter sp.]|nr:anti-sigma factor [Candidatus Angelobacter sp.]
MATIEISCIHVWREISNYIDGEIDPEVRRRMEEHFKGCEHCSAILDGTKNVVRLVGDGHAFDLPRGFSSRLKDRLEKELKG